jgi:hypothetical protein
MTLLLSICFAFEHGHCSDKFIRYKKNEKEIQDRFSFSDFDSRLTFLSFSTAAVGSGLHFWYEPESPNFKKENTNNLDRFVSEIFESDETFTTYGSIASILVFPWIASPFVYYSFKEDYPNNLRKDYIMLQSLAFSMGLQQITSKVVKRERPDGTDNESFYSGHTANSFNMAAFYAASIRAENGGKRTFFSFSPYLAASALSYYRIEENKHYFSDVLAGALIGTLTGNMFYGTYYDDNGRFKKRSTKISPYFRPHKNGGVLGFFVAF